MLQRLYTLSPQSTLHRSGGAYRLLCKHPLHSIELNETAGRLLTALGTGQPLDAIAAGVTASVVRFLDGLVAQGSLLATYRLQAPREPRSFEVVIPVFEDAARLAHCLRGLAAQRYPADRIRVTVVDDGSPHLQEAASPPAPAGLELRWLRLPRNVGPASARNAGVATGWADGRPAAPWLAFVDSDCVPEPGWLHGLAALLDDPYIAVAGGSVRGLHSEGLLGRYEDACSSLFLGARAGPVALPRGALNYLPSCNMAVRRDVYEGAGGFSPGWRFGEDVDLCWRLGAAGHGLFYHPEPSVRHDHRTRLGPFLQRRRLYARSEARLRQAHAARFGRLWQPGATGVLAGAALVCLAVGRSGALLGGAALGGAIVGGAGVLTLALPPIWRGLRVSAGEPRWPLPLLALAAARRAAALTMQQARQLNRQALLPMLTLALLWPRLAPLAAVVWVLGGCAEWLARRPQVGLLTGAVGYGAECLASSLGRIEGALGVARWQAVARWLALARWLGVGRRRSHPSGGAGQTDVRQGDADVDRSAE